jgi:hypothetical protein
MSPTKSSAVCFIGACALFACCASACLASPGGADKLSGWEIMQRSNYAGEQHCYLSALGVRIESSLINTIIDISTRRVTIFKDSAKAYCSMSYDQWKSRIKFNKAKLAKERKITKGATGKIAGLDAVQYVFETVDQGKRRVTEEYWTASPKEIPTKMTAPMSDLANLPPELGVPLKVTQFKKDGRKLILLETVKVSRSSFSKKLYQRPNGYKEVKDPVVLVLGDEE